MKDGIGQAQNKHSLERDKMETMLLDLGGAQACACGRAHAAAARPSRACSLSHPRTITPTQAVTQSRHAVAATCGDAPPCPCDVPPPQSHPRCHTCIIAPSSAQNRRARFWRPGFSPISSLSVPSPSRCTKTSVAEDIQRGQTGPTPVQPHHQPSHPRGLFLSLLPDPAGAA